MSPQSLSIIIPAYNESKRLPRTLEVLEKDTAHRNFIHEIIVVDDGSTDGTHTICEQFSGKLPIRCIRLPHNQGKGSAVREGMRVAEGTWHLYMDADHSVSFGEHIGEMDRLAGDGNDIVIGSIRVPGAAVFEDDPRIYRRLLGDTAKYVIAWAVLPGINDTQRGFKLFSKKASQVVFAQQQCDGYGFDIEVLAIARLLGFSIQEMPVRWQNDAASKVRFSDYLRTLGELVGIVYRIRRGAYSSPIDE